MRDDNEPSILGLVVLGICIVIASFLIYLAWQHYTDNTFDSDRYQLVKIGPESAGSFSAWKFDKRTGYIELCTRTNDAARPLVCIQPLTVEAAKDAGAGVYKDQPAVSSFEQPAPVAPAPAPDAGANNDSMIFKQPAQ